KRTWTKVRDIPGKDVNGTAADSGNGYANLIPEEPGAAYPRYENWARPGLWGSGEVNSRVLPAHKHFGELFNRHRTYVKKDLTFIIVMVIIIIMKRTAAGSIERKYSRKREAILETMRSAKCHPTAQWVYEQLRPRIPDLSLGTVYRNISLFRQEGKLVSVGVVNGEEHFDGFTAPHPHCVCECCGKVFDLPCPDEAALASLTKNLTGFDADFRKTVFYGVCPECVAGTQDA
ncbi:MAG: transcriptional repressor, partial [Treponema sp.]|nr:transcriptional repressor [Treponema sp.]